MNVQKRLSDRGAALIIVLALLAAAAMLSASFYIMLHHTLDDTYRRGREQAALALAEAGLDKTIAFLRAGPKEYQGEEETALGAGYFSTRVNAIEGIRQAWRIQAKGVVYPEVKGFSASVSITATLLLDEHGKIARLTWEESGLCR